MAHPYGDVAGESVLPPTQAGDLEDPAAIEG